MAGRIGACPEIAGALDETSAEVLLPNAVNQHARGERIVWAGNDLRHFKAATAVRERLPFFPGDHL